MFRDIVYSGDSERILKEIKEFISQGIETYSQTYRIVTSDGEVRWIEDRTSIFEDRSTGLRYHQGIVIDIHEQKEAEEKYRRIVETTSEGFLLMDETFRVLDVNSAYAKMLNLSRLDLINQQPLNMEPDEFQRLWLAGEEKKSTECREFEYESNECS